MRWSRHKLECSFKDTVKIYWLNLKLWPELVTSAANLVQDADLTPFSSLSPLSKKTASNVSINGSYLEMILMNDSPYVSHIAVHTFKTFRGFMLKASCASKNMTCFMMLYLNVFHSERKAPLALVVFGNVKLIVQGTVQV